MSARRRPRIPSQIWETMKEDIRRLYLDENVTLEGENGIMEAMMSRYGFTASKSQDETKLKFWGFRKYASKKDWLTLFRILDERETDRGKMVVYLYGDKVSQKKLEKKRSTYRADAIDSLDSPPSQLLPSCFRIETQPSPGADSLPTRATTMIANTTDVSTSSILIFGANDNSSPFNRGAVTDAVPFELDLADFLCTYPSPIPPLAGFPSYRNTMHLSRLGNWSPVQSWFKNSHLDAEDTDMPHLSFPAFSSLATPPSWSCPDSLLTILENSRLAIPNNLIQIFEQSFDWIKAPLHILLPSNAREVVSTRAPSAQVFYFVVYAFINKLVKYERLSYPTDDTDELFRGVTQYFNTLSADRLGSILEQFPNSTRKALEESIFYASVEVGAYRSMETLLDRGLDLSSALFYSGGRERNALEHSLYYDRIDAALLLMRRGYTELRPERVSLLYGNPPSSEVIKSIIKTDFGCLGPVFGWVRKSKDPDLLHFCVECAVRNHQYRQALNYMLEFVEVGDNKIVNSVLHSIPPLWVQDSITIGIPFPEPALRVSISRHNHEATDFLLLHHAEPSHQSMCDAIHSNNLHALQKLLDRGVSPFEAMKPEPWNRTIRQEEYPVEAAFFTEFHEIRNFFTTRGYFKELFNHRICFRRCVRRAIEKGKVDLVEKFIEAYHQHHSISIFHDMADFEFDVGIFYSNPKEIREAMRIVLQREFPYSHSLLSAALLDQDFSSANHMIDICWTQDSRSANEPLHLAVLSGNTAIVHALLDSGFSPYNLWEPPPEFLDWENGPGTPLPLLSTAIYSRNEAMIDFLLEDIHVPLGPKDDGGVHPFLAALNLGDSNSIRKLLQKGARPPGISRKYRAWYDGRGSGDEWKLYHKLLTDRHYDMISLILDAGVKFPVEARWGWETPILIAALEIGDIENLNSTTRPPEQADTGILSILLPFTPNKIHRRSLSDGLVHFMDCESEHCEDVMRRLLAWGADPDHVTKHYWDEHDRSFKVSVLAMAAGMGDLAKVRTLVEAGANVHSQARRGVRLTATQAAAARGSAHVVRYLLELGAKPDEAPAYFRGRTALQFAAAGGYIGIITLLMEHGANPNEPRCPLEGRTAFEAAAENGRIDTLYFLTENGVDLASDGGEQHKNAKWLAEQKGHGGAVDTVEALYVQACQKQAASRMGILEAEASFRAFPDGDLWEI